MWDVLAIAPTDDPEGHPPRLCGAPAADRSRPRSRGFRAIAAGARMGARRRQGSRRGACRRKSRRANRRLPATRSRWRWSRWRRPFGPARTCTHFRRRCRRRVYRGLPAPAAPVVAEERANESAPCSSASKRRCSGATRGTRRSLCAAPRPRPARCRSATPSACWRGCSPSRLRTRPSMARRCAAGQRSRLGPAGARQCGGFPGSQADRRLPCRGGLVRRAGHDRRPENVAKSAISGQGRTPDAQTRSRLGPVSDQSSCAAGPSR